MRPPHYDAIIVGSGFGGAVMAHRLAEQGLSVCVLERGKAYPPGSFPRSPRAMRQNFWDPSEGRQGLFNVWSFRHAGAVVASGLGGGSLIYANVLLRKDERWFVHEDLQGGGYESWPIDREALDPHYDRVQRMLQPRQLPVEHEPYRSTPKMVAFREAARAAGNARDARFEWGLAPLAVTFGNPGEAPVPGEPIREEHANLHGRTRSTCRLCGECNVGCNYGSKNSVDFNYLSVAKRSGARIETRCEVRRVGRREGGGYCVAYVEHSPANEGRKTDTAALPVQQMTCDRLILAAGTLGTTYLLLKSRDALPGLSAALGTRFSGNGDFLTLAYKAQEMREGVRSPRDLDPSFGPVITSFIRGADGLDEGGRGRGFYIEDAGFPAFAGWMAEAAATPGVLARAGMFLWRWFRRLGVSPLRSDIGADVADLLGACARSSGSLPLLGMGRDVPDGRMRLDGAHLDVDWSMDRSAAYFQRVRGAMARLTEELGAQLVDDPVSLLSRVITVHPLGGCPMGRDPAEGVVDEHGEVFGHEGLFIADGAVMPGPVGANPSLTIAALADRFADRVIDGWRKAHPRSRRRRVHVPSRVIPIEALSRARRGAQEQAPDSSAG